MPYLVQTACTLRVKQIQINLIIANNQQKADPAPAHWARASLFEIFKGFIFENFDCRTRINFFAINMQCLQCVFYFLLSLQKHKMDRAPGSKIPGSATVDPL